MNNKFSVGLDIGTTKIVVMVGKKNQFNKIKVLGVGKSQSLGVHRGVVNNITQTIQSIKIAVDSVKKIITTSVDKSKLDAVFQKNLDETKEELKKINS